MLILTPPRAEPEWISVFGARFLMSPINRTLVRKARTAAADAFKGAEEATADQVGEAFTLALLLEGALDWADVYRMADGDDTGAGVPVPFSRDNLAMLLEDPMIFDALDTAYVLPFVTREREKNGSSPSPSGTGAGATLGKIIAGSPARPTKTDGATGAPIASTNPKAKAARKRGQR